MLILLMLSRRLCDSSSVVVGVVGTSGDVSPFFFDRVCPCVAVVFFVSLAVMVALPCRGGFARFCHLAFILMRALAIFAVRVYSWSVVVFSFSVPVRPDVVLACRCRPARGTSLSLLRVSLVDISSFHIFSLFSSYSSLSLAFSLPSSFSFSLLTTRR